MQHEIIADNVYHIFGHNQYEIASTFMRLSEFYESPHAKLRGKYFTVEAFMDSYANDFNNFTYFSDCEGFNVPGLFVRKFFDVFQFDLTLKEQALHEKLKDIIASKSRFYVIGTYREGATLDHELAHSFYYMDPIYKKAMNVVTRSLPKDIHKKMCNDLLSRGYSKPFQSDELQAYCSTSSMVQLTREFNNIEIPWECVLEYKKIFVEAKDVKLMPS